MAKATKKLAGPNGAFHVTACEVVCDPSSPTGWFARGVTREGRLVRVPVPGATLDGEPIALPSPDEQRRLAPESQPWEPGEPKASAEASEPVRAAPAAPAAPPAASPPRAGKRKT